MSTLKTGVAGSGKKSIKANRQAQSQPKNRPATGRAGGLLALLEDLSPGRVVLLVCLLSFLAYANSLGGDFVFDDTEQIVGNADIRSWDNLGKAFTTHVWAFRDRPDALRVPVPPPYYRPMFTVLFTVGYHLFGLWPQGWHLLSLLLHILSSVGVYYVLLLLSESRRMATVGALLFAVFPIHVESVSWISGVTDPLFSLFFLASFYFYLRFRATCSRAHLSASLFLFALSAFSKEPALSMVPLVFLYELIKPEGSAALRAGSDRAREVLPGVNISRVTGAILKAMPFALVAGVYLAARYIVLGGLTWKNPHAYDGPVGDVLLTLPWVIVTYISHLIWPFDLSIAYHSSFVTSAATARFLIPAMMLAAGASALFVFRKKVGRQVWFALALIFVPLLPVLDLRQLSVEYLIFDRYLYLSIAGYGYLIGLGLTRLAESKAQAVPASVALVVLLIGCTAVTARENRSWSDSYSLWSNAARIRPDFWAAHYNAALALMEMKRYGEAREVLGRAARIAPDEPFIFDSLGRASEAMGDTAAAIENFKLALALDPEMFESLNNLGTVYFKSGDYQSAEKQFRQSLNLKPQAVAARFNLALCYSRQGRYAEAAKELAHALEFSPEDAEILYELGVAQERLGRSEEAENTLGRALALSRNQDLTDKISEAISARSR